MIKLIVGLGNPGEQYEKTRHNAGFLFLDSLAKEMGCAWSNQSRFHGLFAECSIAQTKIMLLKPDTFMNRSGQAVGKICRYYKLLPEEMLVVHDELDFNPGVVRLKKDGGHAGHNGLKDIQLTLGTDKYPKLRFGIGNNFPKGMQVEFVLGKWLKEEVPVVKAKIDASIEVIENFAAMGIERTMNLVNNKEFA